MKRHHVQQQVRFSVSNLVAWAPGVVTAGEWQEWHAGTRRIESAGEPALQQMPPLLRRHTSRLGRLGCSVAYDALAARTDVPVVFCSRFGEVSRSVDLLTALAAKEELSPASFGLSVHNAMTGLLSMARKDTANTVALAAGDESVEYGVIEACSLLSEGTSEVLLIVADVPLPDVYLKFHDTEPAAFAFAALISPPNDSCFTLSWKVDESLGEGGVSLVADQMSPTDLQVLDPAGALSVLPVLMGLQTELVRAAGPRSWHWKRDD